MSEPLIALGLLKRDLNLIVEGRSTLLRGTGQGDEREGRGRETGGGREGEGERGGGGFLSSHWCHQGEWISFSKGRLS